MKGPVTIRGLTWDHPRAYEGLEAETALFNAEQSHIRLQWDRHSLRGFETTPIEETTARYDIVILDHPFMGDAARSGCLVDLKAHPTLLPALRSDRFAGPSMQSYAYDGGVWAMPVDAACQTAAYRPDRLDAPPKTLDDLLALARCQPVAMAMACPHAFMNFLTIAGLLGSDISGHGERLLPKDVALEALDLLRELASYLPGEAFGWSSIDTLDAIASRNDIAYCPFVFCFNSYSRSDRKNGSRIAFADVPELRSGRGAAGSVAGGAGLAISASSERFAEAIKVVAHLVSPEVQKRMALSGGQPARREAWLDKDADEVNGGFFSGCRATMDGAVLRPRYPGYMALQNEAGDLLREDATTRSATPSEVIERIEAIFRRTKNQSSL